MNGRCAAVLSTIVLVLVVTAGAFAAGGVYLDDLQVTNDGKVGFFDSFDNCNKGQWTNTYDVSFNLVDGSTTQRLFHMNKHRDRDAAAFANPRVTSAGFVEVTAKLFITPPAEQYLYRKGKASLLNLIVYSAKPGYQMWALVDLSAKAEANRVGIRTQYLTNGKQSGSADFSKTPLLKPNTWAILTLQFDPSNSTATVLLDGSPVATRQYDPGNYETISKLSIQCSYGDGAQVTN